jgi:hypothetical protein
MAIFELIYLFDSPPHQEAWTVVQTAARLAAGITAERLAQGPHPRGRVSHGHATPRPLSG